MRRFKSSWRFFCSVVVLIGIVAAFFSLGIVDGHLGLDDWGYTFGCPFVKGGFSFAHLKSAFLAFDYGAIWMPLTFLTYMLDISLWGDSWIVFHVTNVVLHLANAFLVFLFLRTFLGRILTADPRHLDVSCLLASLVWSLHPQRAEAVSFIASRKEELWTLFALLTMICHLRYLDEGRARQIVFALLFFILACLSKPTAMCLPVLLLLTQLTFPADKMRHLRLLVPFFGIAACIGALTLYSQNAFSGTDSISWRLLNAAVSLGLYVFYGLFPFGIHFDYRAVFSGWPVNGVLGLLVLMLSVFVYFLLRSRLSQPSRRVLLWAALFSFVALLPTLGVFGYVNGDQAMADRYVYLPHVGAAVLLAFVLTRLLMKGRRIIAFLAVSVMCLVEGIVLPDAIRSYANDYAAAVRTLSADPDHWRALRTIGNEYCARLGRTDEGVALLRRSLALRSSQRTAESLAYILAFRGQPGDHQEVDRLCVAVRRNPVQDRSGMMLDALGVVEMKKGNRRAALEFFSAALRAPDRNHSRSHTLSLMRQCSLPSK